MRKKFAGSTASVTGDTTFRPGDIDEFFSKRPCGTLLGLALTASAGLSEVPSGAYGLDKTHGYITFSYSHLGFSNPHVGFRSFEVDLNLDNENIENSVVSVTIDATSVDSRVEVFNGHRSAFQRRRKYRVPTGV